jgi:predicted nucleic acid-binding protein
MAFVVDASVSLAWLFEDEVSEQTDDLLDRLRDERALVPSLWTYEIANALTVAQRRSRITEAQARVLVETLQSLPIDRADSAPAGVLLALASKHRLSAYDAAYLELAERTGLALATLDDRLRAAAEAAGVQLLPV